MAISWYPCGGCVGSQLADLCASASVQFWRNLPLFISSLDSSFKVYCEETGTCLVFCIFFIGIPLDLEVSLTCLEQWRLFHTVTNIRKLWRKCLSLCASHFFINQTATGLSSGQVSPTLLQEAVTALRLSVQILLVFSPILSFILSNIFSLLCLLPPLFWLLSFLLCLCPHSLVFFSLSSVSLSLSVATGS